MDKVMGYLFVLLQRVLPRYLLTALTWRLARIRVPAIKDWLVRTFVRIYDVNVDEVALDVPAGFATFNEFFTRELANGARPLDDAPDGIVSPVDGTVSAAGRIDDDLLLQAKGVRYSLADLLATDLDDARVYLDGHFATIYLAPYNYHRIHIPRTGRLVAARYVPGDLYSVNVSTVALLPRLFARNERLICHFDTAAGPLALIFVGALNVGSISTIWTGELRPRKKGVVEDLTPVGDDKPLDVARGEMIGWFNMGSTVILLLPPNACDGFDELVPGATVVMGQRISRARLPATDGP